MPLVFHTPAPPSSESSVLKVSLIQSSVLSTFHGTHAVQLTLDTGAASNVDSCFVCNVFSCAILFLSATAFLLIARSSQPFLLYSQTRVFSYSNRTLPFLPSGEKETLEHWPNCQCKGHAPSQLRRPNFEPALSIFQLTLSKSLSMLDTRTLFPFY